MSKFVKLVFGNAYHAEGILFQRGEKVKVSDAVFEALKEHKEKDVELVGQAYVVNYTERFEFSEGEETYEEKLEEVLEETKEVEEKPAKRGRKPTVLEQVEEELAKG